VALESWLGEAFEDDSLSGMRATLARHHVRPTLTCATDGNHGRAVARLARLLGLAARVYVPRDMSAERQNAISGEGAEVVVVDGSYDEAVVFSAEHAGGDDVLVSDTSWPGYTHVPQAVVEGYSTMLTEIDAQLADAGAEPPDLVVVPAGVGALAAAVTGHVRRSFGAGTVVVLVEPIVANCIQQSILAGRPTTVPGPHTSIMAGLNCGEVSLVAWPVIKAGVDWSATIHDDAAREGMRLLAAAGYDVGECGAAGVGTLLTFDPQLLTGRERPSVLLISTEGPTDVDAFVEVVGRPPRAAM